MRVKREKLIMVGDFETTVYDGQERTDVWASALVELGTEDVHIFGSIDDTFQYLKGLKRAVMIYYHNLKFDGHFWLDYLIHELKYTQATEETEDGNILGFKQQKDMNNGEFIYTISDMGQWYTIKIKVNNCVIEIRDSLKLMPFSVKQIGKAFKTKHQKLEMEYKGFRYPGCNISPEEKEYLANDVLVVAEALQIMKEQGHNKLTIGACCMSEYKNTLEKFEFEINFPDLSLIEDPVPGFKNADEYIRKSYHGGWCYVVKGKENKIFHNGVTADVNSLYPSRMHSSSGCRYPTGHPTFWVGDYIPDIARDEKHYFFIRFRCRFKIKKNKLPFIQIKGNLLYKSTEMLVTSDVKAPDGTYSRFYHGKDGELKDTYVTMTLTCTDWYLFLEHYDVMGLEILDGCYFESEAGLFDTYINKYKEIKQHSSGAMRTLAKLFLNNLYGKMATSDNSSFKVAIDTPGGLKFAPVEEHNKKVVYIAVGSAITSYAREFTIRAAQKNYHGADKPGFIYADTDSIHCDLKPDELVGVPVHDTEFNHWKLESCWDIGLFVRQKTYLEHVTHEDLKPVEPFYNVKCAGMPDKCKQLFIESFTGPDPKKIHTEAELKFLEKKRTIEDFKIGLVVPGKLLPKCIPGGVILKETTFEMRDR